MGKRIGTMLLSVLLCLALLSGCSPKGQAPAAAAPGGTPADTVRVGIAELSGTYDPFWYSTADESRVQELLFDYLIGFDAEGQPVPELADWTVSEDGLVYTFLLKEGLKYSDGSPIVSSDFAFALEVYDDPGYDGYSDYSMVGIRGYDDYRNGEAQAISGVATPDERTLVITLEKPSLNAIYSMDLPAVSRAYYGADYVKGQLDGVRERTKLPLGSGQYVYDGAVEGQSLTLKANPLHYRGRPGIGTCVFTVTPAGMELERLILGETDLECSYPEPDYLKQAAGYDFIQSYLFPSASFSYLGLNDSLPMFSDALTRQALACAIDRAGVTAMTYGENARMLTAPVSQDSWANRTEGLDLYGYDLDRAMTLLSQAGWKKNGAGRLERDGKPFAIQYTIDAGNTVSEAMAVAMADSLGRLGINVTTETVEFNAMYDKILNGDIEMWFGTIGLLPDPGVTSLYHTDGYQNFGQYSDAESDALMEAVDTASNSGEREALYIALWQRLNQELPAIWCYQRNEFWVANRALAGLKCDSYNDFFHNFYQVSIKE
jgi:peptide/nickel transport system substrate-binding protein